MVSALMTRFSEFRTAAMMLTALLRIRPKRDRQIRRPKRPNHSEQEAKRSVKSER